VAHTPMSDQLRRSMRDFEKRMSSAAVALFDRHGRVLVVKAHYKHYWSFPGGVIDAGETPRVAACREIFEEVGIRIEPDDLTFRMVVDRAGTVAETYQFVFESMLDEFRLDAVRSDDKEIEQWAFVTREEILAGNRHYSPSTEQWANGNTGYFEQVFDGDPHAIS